MFNRTTSKSLSRQDAKHAKIGAIFLGALCAVRLSSRSKPLRDAYFVRLPSPNSTANFKYVWLVHDSGDEDVMLARITTQEARDRADVHLSGWKAAGLIAESVVRLSKVATIKKSLVDRHLGALSANDRAVVRRAWARMFPAAR